MTDLQADDLLTRDLWHFSNQPSTKNEAMLKGISDVVTTNRIGIEANTAFIPMRGRLDQ